MDKNFKGQPNAEARMQGYLQKIATGPTMSKDMTEAEAEDGLSLILNGEVSSIRSAVFLIATRMKRETLAENIGFWRALDRSTIKRDVKLDQLLQIADPFDGFERTPYFGFYAIPVIAAMGLPTYGHSTLPLPPKFGITFGDILHNHYQVPVERPLEKSIQLLEDFQFGYFNTTQTHPKLENLRELRNEIIKRTSLATFEKMLMPLIAASGGNYLATTYFHKGYEVPMIAVSERSGFDITVIGNGMEGTTLFGVHKPARIFIDAGESKPCEISMTLEETFFKDTPQKIREAYEELKNRTPALASLAAQGEAALKSNQGPAAPLIACQAATLCYYLDLSPDPQTAFEEAEELLKQGKCYENLMSYIERLQEVKT
ncbi:MAG: hypothetical protein ACE5EK_05470 [Nitrospinales bacterium]